MRGVLTFVLAWIALFWLWLAYQGEWNRVEWIAAAGAATLGASFTTALVGVGLLRVRIPVGALAGARSVPLQVVVDFAIITHTLVRRLAGSRVRGTFVVRPRESHSPGERAARALLATYSPNAYAVDIGATEELLHDLVPNRDSEKPA